MRSRYRINRPFLGVNTIGYVNPYVGTQSTYYSNDIGYVNPYYDNVRYDRRYGRTYYRGN